MALRHKHTGIIKALHLSQYLSEPKSNKPFPQLASSLISGGVLSGVMLPLCTADPPPLVPVETRASSGWWSNWSLRGFGAPKSEQVLQIQLLTYSNMSYYRTKQISEYRVNGNESLLGSFPLHANLRSVSGCKCCLAP